MELGSFKRYKTKLKEINKNTNRKKISLVTIIAFPIKFCTLETRELLHNPLIRCWELLPHKRIYRIFIF